MENLLKKAPAAIVDQLDNYVWALIAFFALMAMGFPTELSAAFVGAIIRHITGR